MEEYDHELASRLLSEFLRDYPDGPPPPWFATFDKRALVDWDQLIERLKANSGKELSEITGEVRQYEEWGLLPACHMDNGTPGYPLYTHLRIRFIRELIDKWHYDTVKLRQIIRWEETLIDEILTTEELSSSASQLIESFVFYLESEIANTEKELGRKRNPKKKKTIGESLGGMKMALSRLKEKGIEGLPGNIRTRFEVLAREEERLREEFRILTFRQEQVRALLGFSPNVLIKVTMINRTDDGTLSGGYPYSFDDSGVFFRFGVWDRSRILVDDEFDFFATPEFLIEIDSAQKINISIRDWSRVDIRYMRGSLAKVHKALRERLGRPRKGWGESSGRKKLIAERNIALKERYREERLKKPGVSVEHIRDRVLEQINKEFGEKTGVIGDDRAKYIIYSEK